MAVVVGVVALVALAAFLPGRLFGAGRTQGAAQAAPSAVSGAPATSAGTAAARTAAPRGSASAHGSAHASAAASATHAPAPAGHRTSAAPAAPVPAAGQRVVTFVNATAQTVWPAAQADPKEPLARTGWVLPPGASVSLLMPDGWNGRLWGRTGCSFDAAGQGHCVTGDCDGRFQCGTAGSTAPETLAEFDLNAWGGMDFYDVNLDGFNLPMWINHTGGTTPDKVSADGCIPAGCTHDLLATCPSALQDRVGGSVVGCLGPCTVFNTDQYCCRGAWSTRATCLPARWPVDYAAIFKRAEPTGYSYVYDDQSSVYTCSGGCDYRITFGVSR
ncbi:thaumatin family protein [Streptacidiphilus sp. PB12-B1b]|uniref:thaumatin family protein n=1 Tax=Streptacidiphilus sp. PB12-B1b TaxID=2705012 RepID=UPI001CDC7FCF|nr:thaumatin family protein [Streptacidiphilus sp. PB12-B1b]